MTLCVNAHMGVTLKLLQECLWTFHSVSKLKAFEVLPYAYISIQLSQMSVLLSVIPTLN